MSSRKRISNVFQLLPRVDLEGSQGGWLPTLFTNKVHPFSYIQTPLVFLDEVKGLYYFILSRLITLLQVT